VKIDNEDDDEDENDGINPEPLVTLGVWLGAGLPVRLDQLNDGVSIPDRFPAIFHKAPSSSGISPKAQAH
jgi:hypothetical protein